jgi:hypothetical protein
VALNSYGVTLKGAGGYSRTFVVLAADEWQARRVAILRNVRGGGQVAWCDSCVIIDGQDA